VGDFYRFYEVNPLVADSANTLFTYLRDSRARVTVALGDARLTLDAETAQHFDTLVLDAFSGDTIPVHLLTQEAFRGYFRHLNEDGVLAANVSSQYLDLAPVVAEIAAALGRTAIVVDSPDHADQYVSHAIWVLATKDRAFLEQVRSKHHGEPVPVGRRHPWTDRYSNILAALL
jgi:spermidine synthase